jgi:DNA polymerase-3 subunit beta
MKIECSKEQLSQALNKLDKISGKNISIPVLSCILFDATADKLLLRSTNLEIALEIAIKAKIIEKGMVAIPSHAVASYIASLDKEKDITLEVKAGNIYISSSLNNTIIKSQPHENFPSIPNIENPISFSIKSSILNEGIKAVSYSAGQSSIKPELSSVYIYTYDNHMYFVCTDSFRLAEKKISFKAKEDWNTLIPIKNINDITRILEDINSDIEVMITKHQIVIRTDNIYLTSRVIEGSFPDYKQIIPKENKTEVTILKQDLLKAFKLATIFSDKFNKLNIKTDENNKKVFIKTSNSDIGETVTEIPATIKGDTVEINFNHKYIHDCIQSIQSASLSFGFNNTGKLLIKGVSDSSFIYLVMPMNR